MHILKLGSFVTLCFSLVLQAQGLYFDRSHHRITDGPPLWQHFYREHTNIPDKDETFSTFHERPSESRLTIEKYGVPLIEPFTSSSEDTKIDAVPTDTDYVEKTLSKNNTTFKHIDQAIHKINEVIDKQVTENDSRNSETIENHIENNETNEHNKINNMNLIDNVTRDTPNDLKPDLNSRFGLSGNEYLLITLQDNGNNKPINTAPVNAYKGRSLESIRFPDDNNQVYNVNQGSLYSNNEPASTNVVFSQNSSPTVLNTQTFVNNNPTLTGVNFRNPAQTLQVNQMIPSNAVNLNQVNQLPSNNYNNLGFINGNINPNNNLVSQNQVYQQIYVPINNLPANNIQYYTLQNIPNNFNTATNYPNVILVNSNQLGYQQGVAVNQPGYGVVTNQNYEGTVPNSNVNAGSIVFPQNRYVLTPNQVIANNDPNDKNNNQLFIVSNL